MTVNRAAPSGLGASHDRWHKFCRDRNYTATQIQRVLGWSSISVWVRMTGKSIDEAMRLMDEHYLDRDGHNHD